MDIHLERLAFLCRKAGHSAKEFAEACETASVLPSPIDKIVKAELEKQAKR